ncbi:MAG TPA: substrate-binding domain-containing protein [Bacteroidales bacterium]|nr:substrate-binding domain-containing protein [Bacteroidales bacterium]
MDRIKKTSNQRVTIKDIASMAGVSIGTVDRVLHHRGEVNQETHDRVMSFIQKLGYTPNLLAKSLALKKKFNIAVLIPDSGKNNPYWKNPMEGFSRASHELKDFNTTISVSHYDPGNEQSFIDKFASILSSSPDGLIMAPHFHDAALKPISVCKEKGIPLMFIDNNLDGQALAYFGQDAFQSGIVAAKLMHQALRGNAMVIVLNMASNKIITRHMQKREDGFRHYFTTLQSTGKIDILSVAIDLSLKKEPAHSLNRLFEEYPSISGIFVTNSRVYRVAPVSEKHQPVVLIGYDLVDDNIRYLEKGSISFLICQKPQEQAYKSAMAMFSYLLSKKPAEEINYSAIDIIVKENVQYYKNNN